MNHKLIARNTAPIIDQATQDLVSRIAGPDTPLADRYQALTELYDTYLSRKASYARTFYKDQEAVNERFKTIINALSEPGGIEILIAIFTDIPVVENNEYYHHVHTVEIQVRDIVAETLNTISGLNPDTLRYLKNHPKMPPIISHIQDLHRMDDWC